MNVPNHIAIILDGNGRWAKERGMPRTYGHVKGCANLENICYDIKDLGVKYLTVYAFSTENRKRSREEVEALMKLFHGGSHHGFRNLMPAENKYRKNLWNIPPVPGHSAGYPVQRQ